MDVTEGERHLGGKRWAQAIECFSNALATKQDDGWLWFQRGQAYKGSQQLALAESDFSQAMSLLSNPTASLYYQRGHCRLLLQRYEQAVADFSTAIEKQSEPSGYMYFARCQALAHLLRYEEALNDVQNALKLDPLDPDKQAWETRLLPHCPGRVPQSSAASEQNLTEDMMLLRQLVGAFGGTKPTKLVPVLPPTPLVDEEERQLMLAVERAERMAALRKRLAEAEASLIVDIV